MVLTFGLCATFAFAQTQTATLRAPQVSKAASTAAQVQNDRSSNYSIFTKDVTLLTVDFHDGSASGDVYTGTGYTTGKITSGLEAHGQNYAFATWRRIPNADSSTWADQASTYSRLAQSYFGGVTTFCSYMSRYCDTANTTGENGIMMMSLYDQASASSGNFNAYIALQQVSTTGQDVVDVAFYQYYRKFYDHCYIDYSVNNGTSWIPVEINVRGVDMAVNDIASGYYTFTLPLAAANQATLDVRIRYSYIDPLNHAAYGYFWLIDDVSIIGGPKNRLKYYTEEYTEGNYGLVPQGMQIDPAWYTMVKNTGAVAQANTTITLNHLNAAQDVMTPISTYNNGTIDAGNDADLVCDPYYWLYYDSLDYRGWYEYAQTNGQGRGTANTTLPTADAGTNYVFASLVTDSLTHNFDTHYYNVTTLDNTIGAYRWGHDNGVLTYAPSNYFLFGYVLGEDGTTWYVTEDPDDVDYYAAGYTMTSRFTTGATVPEGWVIRGVELVASPSNNPNYHTNGAVIQGKLYQDAYDGGRVGFNEIATGAGTYQVVDADLNDSSIIGRNSHGYRELGEYNTIKIMFPEQPALAANTSYRVGYAISEDSYIALAHECLGSYREASPTRPDQYDTILYFRNDASTYKYANRFIVNQYQTYMWDPIRENGHTFASYYVDYNPMIRLLVGPEQQVERVNVDVECTGEDFGSVYYGGQEACGTTVTPVEHSTPVFTLSPEEGCMISELRVDGVVIEPYDEDEDTGDPNYELGSNGVGRYAFADIAGNHTITATFMEDTTTPEPPQSINGVYSNVRMNLQPNPATSQVVLSVEGVSGMVNCAIIDMSGRVVYTAMVNTENAQVINLNNIAKGAYFVRITNSDFSKVEKLIVR